MIINSLIKGKEPTGKLEITSTDEVDVSDYATAQVVDENLVASNIKKDTEVLGVTGTYEGVVPTGNITLRNLNQTDVSDYATAQVTDSNLIASNIKKDVTILGVTGTSRAVTEIQSRNETSDIINVGVKCWVNKTDAGSANYEIYGTSPTIDTTNKTLTATSSSGRIYKNNPCYYSESATKRVIQLKFKLNTLTCSTREIARFMCSNINGTMTGLASLVGGTESGKHKYYWYMKSASGTSLSTTPYLENLQTDSWYWVRLVFTSSQAASYFSVSGTNWNLQGTYSTSIINDYTQRGSYPYSTLSGDTYATFSINPSDSYFTSNDTANDWEFYYANDYWKMISFSDATRDTFTAVNYSGSAISAGDVGTVSIA